MELSPFPGYPVRSPELIQVNQLQPKPYDAIRDRAKFIGGMGPVQKPMVWTLFFIALKHGVNTFFAVSGHGADTFFFPLPWSQREAIYRKKCSCSYIFHWSSRQSLKCSCTYRSVWEKNLTPCTATTANTTSRNILWRQYLWKQYDLPQYKTICLIVWRKMIECHGARTFFLLSAIGQIHFYVVVCHGALTFLVFSIV